MTRPLCELCAGDPALTASPARLPTRSQQFPMIVQGVHDVKTSTGLKNSPRVLELSEALINSFLFYDLITLHRKDRYQGKVTIATISCISAQDQCLCRRTVTLFLLNGL